MSIVVEEGAEASLDCSTEGLPKPRVYWIFNGHNVQDDGNIKITGTPRLFTLTPLSLQVL